MNTKKTKESFITDYQFLSVLRSVTKVKAPSEMNKEEVLYYLHRTDVLNIPFKYDDADAQFITVQSKRIPVLSEFNFGKEQKSTLIDTLNYDIDNVYVFVDIFLKPQQAFYFAISYETDQELQNFIKLMTRKNYMVREFENYNIVTARMSSFLNNLN